MSMQIIAKSSLINVDRVVEFMREVYEMAKVGRLGGSSGQNQD